MVKSFTNNFIYASRITPDPAIIGYWADLHSDPLGRRIKVWNGFDAWVPICDGGGSDYELPWATYKDIGGVMLGTPVILPRAHWGWDVDPNKVYPVGFDEDNRLTVHVPWKSGGSGDVTTHDVQDLSTFYQDNVTQVLNKINDEAVTDVILQTIYI